MIVRNRQGGGDRPPAPDIIIPKGRPFPGQYELFQPDSNTSQ